MSGPQPERSRRPDIRLAAPLFGRASSWHGPHSRRGDFSKYGFVQLDLHLISARHLPGLPPLFAHGSLTRFTVGSAGPDRGYERPPILTVDAHHQRPESRQVLREYHSLIAYELDAIVRFVRRALYQVDADEGVCL